MLQRKTPLKKSNKPLNRTGFRTGKPTPIRSRKKSEEEIQEAAYQRTKMTAFFQDCERVLGNRSDISNSIIHNPGRINYHHIKEKELYKELQYSFNNIIICTSDEHQNIHSDSGRYEIVQVKLTFILNNWEFCVQQGNSWSEKYDEIHRLSNL